MKRLALIVIVLVLISSLILSGCQSSTPAPSPVLTPATSAAPAKTTSAPPAATSAAPAATSAAPSAKPTSAGTEPQSGGTLKIVMAFSLSNIGYTPTLSGAMTYPTDPVYEGLLWNNFVTGEFSPWLAQSYQADPAGKSMTVKLRSGIKFHDGTSCDAKAVKDYLTLKMSKQKGWMANVQSIDIADPLTLKFNTTLVDQNFMAQLNEPISSPAWLAKGEDAVAFKPVGTGPYKFSDYKQNSYLKYVRFDDYWGGKPYLDGINIILVPDKQTEIATLLSGEADVDYNVSFQDVARVKAAGFNLVPITAVYYGFAPDSTTPGQPLANPKVVQAINCAINKKNIADTLGYGYMYPSDSVIPSSVKGYQPGQGYDPAKAAQLLKDANLASGFDLTITTSPLANADAMVAVQSDLAKVGIKAKIDLADMGRWFGSRISGWKNSLLFVYGIYGQPYTYYFNRTWNKSQPDRYVSAARPAGFDDGLAKLTAENNPAAQIPILQTLAKQMEDGGMYIPFMTQGQVAAISPKVHDYGIFKDSMTMAGLWKYKTWMSK